MANISSILSILVDANTGTAQAKLRQFDRQMDTTRAKAARDIQARLGASFDPAAFTTYERALDRAQRRTRDKAAFKASLGGDFNTKAFNSYERAIDKAQVDHTRLTSTVDRNNGRLTSSFGSLAKGIAGTAVAFVGFGAISNAVQQTAKFQQSMEQIRTQAGGTQAEVNRTSKAVLGLAASVGTGPNSLAQGLYHLESQGLRGAKAIGALRAAAEGARIGNANLEDVTNALGAAVVSGIKGVQNMSEAMGALNAVVGAGDMRMQDLADALSTGLLGPMKQYGVSLRDVGAALAVFGDNNIRGADAGTKLLSTIRIMAAPSNAAAKVLKTLGLSATQLADDIRQHGLLAALQDLKKHLVDSGESGSKAARTLAQAFGGRQSTGVLLLLGQLDRLKLKQDEVSKGASTLGDSWVATKKTFALQMDQVKAGFEALEIHIGTIFLPIVGKAASGVLKFVGQMQTGVGPGGKFAAMLRDVWGAVKSLWAALSPMLDQLVGPLVAVVGLIGGFAQALGRLFKAAPELTQFVVAMIGFSAAGNLVIGALTRLAVPLLGFLTMWGRLGGTNPFSGMGAKARLEAGIAADAVSAAGVPAAAGFTSKFTSKFARVGAKLAGVVSGAMRVLPWIGILAPAGFALYSVVKGWIDRSARKQGEDFANKFTADLPGRVTDAVRKGLVKAGSLPVPTAKTPVVQPSAIPGAPTTLSNAGQAVAAARSRVADLERQAAKAGLAPAQAQGFTEAARSKLQQALATYTKIYQTWFQQMYSASWTSGKKSGDAWVAQWRTVKFPTELLSLNSMLKSLSDVPASIKAAGAPAITAWRNEAAQQMLAYATTLEEKGKLPKGAVDNMIATLEQAFPPLAAYLIRSGQGVENTIAKAMKLTQAQANWRKALSNFRDQWGETAISQHITTDNIVSNTQAAMHHLEQLISKSTGKQRKNAENEYNALRQTVKDTFSGMESDVAAKQAAMTKSIASGSQQAATQAGKNLYNYEQRVYDAMSSGLLSSNQGAKLITQALDATLKAFGAKPIPMPSSVSGLSAPGKGLTAGTNAATGALIQFGAAGARGHDNIPVNFGGVPVVVGSGEVGAVLTHDQQRFLNARTADVGGLRGVFSKLNRKHYMSGGGMVPEMMASGGVPAMMGKANWINAQHYPYVWGGGHNSSFAGPYDCSGAVSAVLHAAGLLNAPEVASQFMSYGLPGPGAVSIYASPAHTFMSIMGKFFGTHGSSGAGWYSGSALPGFAVRHAPVGGSGSIATPKVGGSGTIATIVRKALGKMAGAANNVIAKKFAATIAGGGTGGGDFGTFGSMRALGEQMMLAHGWGLDQWPALNALWTQESGWNPSARNPSSGAAGIPQDITGNMHGGARGQIAWGLNYIAGRYGSPAAAEAHEKAFNWYGKGGLLPFVGSFKDGGTIARDGMAHVHKGETVIPAANGILISHGGHTSHTGHHGRRAADYARQAAAATRRAASMLQALHSPGVASPHIAAVPGGSEPWRLALGIPAIPPVTGIGSTIGAAKQMGRTVNATRTGIGAMEHQMSIMDSVFSWSSTDYIDPITGEINQAVINQRVGELKQLADVAKRIFDSYTKLVLWLERQVETYRHVVAQLAAKHRNANAVVTSTKRLLGRMSLSGLKGPALTRAHKRQGQLRATVSKYQKIATKSGSDLATSTGSMNDLIGQVTTELDNRDSAWLDWQSHLRDILSVATTKAQPTSGALGAAGSVLAPPKVAAGTGLTNWVMGTNAAGVSVVPAFARGGTSLGGWALVGEQGPELAHLPSGTRIHPNSETPRGLGGPTMIQVVVEDGAVNADRIRVIANDEAAVVVRRESRNGGRGLPGRPGVSWR